MKEKEENQTKAKQVSYATVLVDLKYKANFGKLNSKALRCNMNMLVCVTFSGQLLKRDKYSSAVRVEER